MLHALINNQLILYFERKMRSGNIKLRTLGIVTKGGRLWKPNEPSYEEPSEGCESPETFTSVNTAFSPFVKKEEDSGTFPIPTCQFNYTFNQQISIKKEDDFDSEGQFADYGEVEEADEEECQCYKCLQDEVVFMEKKEYEESIKKNKPQQQQSALFKDFIEQLNDRGEITTIHRQRHTNVKKVYDCTFGNCNLTFSSLQTIHYHIRTRHLNLKPTLEQQKKCNKVETCLPKNNQPSHYVKARNKSMNGYLVENVETEKLLEKLFNLANILNYKEREHLVFISKLCESVVVAWWQRRRDRERYAEKTRRMESILEYSTMNRPQNPEPTTDEPSFTDVAFQMSPHSATAASQILSPPCSPPSTSSHTNKSAHLNPNIISIINSIKRQLNYSKEKAKKIVKAKLKNGKAIRPQTNLSSSPNNRRDNIRDDQNSDRSTDYSDNDSNYGRNCKSPKKSSATNSAALNSNAKYSSSQTRKRTAREKFKTKKIAHNKSSLQEKLNKAIHSTSESVRKQIFSQKVQLNLDNAKVRKRHNSRQSTIDPQPTKWNFKIPKLTQNRQ